MYLSQDKERISLLELHYPEPHYVFKIGLVQSNIRLGLLMKRDEKQTLSYYLTYSIHFMKISIF